MDASPPATIPNAEPAQGCSRIPGARNNAGLSHRHAWTAERRWMGMPSDASWFAIPNLEHGIP